MDSVRTAPTAGIVSALFVVGLLAAPYLVIVEASSVGAYYGLGPVPPLTAGLFALIAVIVFAAGREDRTDPALAAGASLVFGVFSLGICLAWALSVPSEVAVSIGTVRGASATFMEYHRYLLVLATLAMTGAAGWYARTLRLL